MIYIGPRFVCCFLTEVPLQRLVNQLHGFNVTVKLISLNTRFLQFLCLNYIITYD
jgi:hypothetical protein